MIKKIRFCLKKNKIFIEVANIILIAILTFIVAFSTYHTNKTMVVISKNQNEPIITISSEITRNNKKNEYVQEYLNIYNYGEPALNLNIKNYTYIKVYKGNSFANIPLDGYYFLSFANKNIKGKIYTRTGYNNYKNVSSIQRKILNDNKFSGFEINHLTKITYNNKLNEVKSKYFINNLDVNEKTFIETANKIDKFPKLSIEQLDLKNLDKFFQKYKTQVFFEK